MSSRGAACFLLSMLASSEIEEPLPFLVAIDYRVRASLMTRTQYGKLYGTRNERRPYRTKRDPCNLTETPVRTDEREKTGHNGFNHWLGKPPLLRMEVRKTVHGSNQDRVKKEANDP